MNKWSTAGGSWIIKFLYLNLWKISLEEIRIPCVLPCIFTTFIYLKIFSDNKIFYISCVVYIPHGLQGLSNIFYREFIADYNWGASNCWVQVFPYFFPSRVLILACETCNRYKSIYIGKHSSTHVLHQLFGEYRHRCEKGKCFFRGSNYPIKWQIHICWREVTFLLLTHICYTHVLEKEGEERSAEVEKRPEKRLGEGVSCIRRAEARKKAPKSNVKERQRGEQVTK